MQVTPRGFLHSSRNMSQAAPEGVQLWRWPNFPLLSKRWELWTQNNPGQILRFKSEPTETFQTKPMVELCQAHCGYVSSVRFWNRNFKLTGMGRQTN